MTRAARSRAETPAPTASPLAARIEAIGWSAVEDALNAQGCAVLPALLDPDACASLAGLYDDPVGDAPGARFRSRVVMARHGFGRGEYRYFAYPLPGIVSTLRHALYAPLAAIANRWSAALDLRDAAEVPIRFPATLDAFLARCHAAGQTRPTPLLLRYGPDDWNCLHQDLYGEHVFPLQVVVLLSQPTRDFTGGELVLTEQRPRMQSRPMVVPLARQGDAVVIPVHHRPVQGTRGVYRVTMRHGVSRITSGSRHTLGVILHDAA